MRSGYNRAPHPPLLHSFSGSGFWGFVFRGSYLACVCRDQSLGVAINSWRLGFMIDGSRYTFHGVECRVQGSVPPVQGSGCKVHQPGFRLESAKFRIEGVGCRV